MTDRRIRKTEKALQDAFIQLIMEEDLKQITVKELCARADINKSTFYLHYRDIFDLASSLKRKLLDDTYDVLAQYDILEFSSLAPEIWEQILELFRKSNCMYLQFLNSPSLFSLSPTLEEHFIPKIMEKTRRDHPELSEKTLTQIQSVVIFVISGFLGLMQNLDFERLSDAGLYISRHLNFPS